MSKEETQKEAMQMLTDSILRMCKHVMDQHGVCSCAILGVLDGLAEGMAEVVESTHEPETVN